ncbi:MAG: TerB family tellurite resistance protein [Chitinophagales bacterium]
MDNSEKLLKDYSDLEKGAYLGAIASIATADHSATDEETEFLRALAESADLSEVQEESIVRAAKELSTNELERCLDVLKQSDLRFSLLTDIISFAKSDGKYSPEEQKNVEEIAQRLDVNRQQFSLLDQFVDHARDKVRDQEEVARPGFLESLGLGDKFKKAGINTPNFTKGLLGIVGPMLIAKMLTGAMQGKRNFNSGMLSNQLGRRGLNNGATGGIGSLISLLSSGRGYNSMGNVLSKFTGQQNRPRSF